MKRFIIIFSFTFILSVISANLFAQGIDVGFHLGLSTPNDKIANVYNKNQIKLNGDSLGNLVSRGMDAGYHLAFKGRIGLADNADLYLGFGYHKFPQTKIEVIDPQTKKVLATLNSTTNIIPISAGLNLYPIRSIIGIYATGDLSYNYISSSLDYKIAGVEVPLTKTPTDGRLGFGLGAGVDLPLGLILLNLEAKYNYINFIGKTDKEDSKNYLSVALGVYF